MAAVRSKLRRPAAAKSRTRKSPVRKKAMPQTFQPLLSLPLETSDAYLARLAIALAAVGTHVYFDASFLMWLVKLGRPARSQFIGWVRSVDDAKFHVPLWAAHEFFKHRIRNSVHHELSGELDRFEKASAGLYEKARSFACDELFGYAHGGANFIDEYRRTLQPLRSMLELAKKRLQNEIDFGTAEIADFIDQHLLAGPLDGIIENIETDERVRNRGVIPPSFKDAHKRGPQNPAAQSERPELSGDNSFGDLVLWREILRHGSAINATIVIATADRKNDWFVNFKGHEGLSPDLRNRPLSPRPVPMAHPLLVREAADKGAGAILLMDPLYCGAMIEMKGAQYADFATAAIDTRLAPVQGGKLEAQIWSAKFGDAGRLVGSSTRRRRRQQRRRR